MKLMNKCLVMLFFVVCSVSAMNEDSDKPCYLNSLPAEVLNYIASFLMETEEELIERTRDLSNQDRKTPFHKLHEVCPDNVSSISISDSRNNLKLSIYKDYEDVYRTALDRSEHKCIALSRGCSRIGMYRSEKFFRPPHENINYRYFLEIQKIELYKDEEDEAIIVLGEKYKLPDQEKPQYMGFNKQGTLFIVHYKNMFTQKPEHTIFDLKKLVNPNLKEEVIHTNKLQTYLRDKFVCSKYIQGASK